MTQAPRFTGNCPLPKLGFDVITMAHGSGGLLTHQLLESAVFKLLKNDHLDDQHDGALLEVSGKIAFSTDSYVISPVFFPGGNIGDLAVNGTVNDLAMCGAIPRYLSLSFILEEGFAMDDLWQVMVSIKAASERAGVKVVTGDTKVVEKGKGDGIFINTSGIGEIHPKASINYRNIKAGDKVIVSGPIATHGIAILSKRKGLEFETTLESDTAPLHHIVKRLLDLGGNGIHFMRDATRGGVATVLNEVSGQSQLGVDLEQSEIPVLEQVEGACELLGLDPLYVANEGVMLAVVSSEIAQNTIKEFHQNNFPAASIIGEITGKHRQVVMHGLIGGRRVLSYLPGEQLPRIC